MSDFDLVLSSFWCSHSCRVVPGGRRSSTCDLPHLLTVKDGTSSGSSVQKPPALWLTPEDSGNFTCECSRLDGTYVVHLNITVEEDEDASSSREMPFVDVVVGVLVFVVVTAVILGVICRKTHHRRLTGPVASHPHTEAENIEPYSSFMQRENVLYSTATFLSSRNTNTLNVLTRDDTSAEL
ncbi:uncharacterized protein LOC143316110 isoform X2 [Chaetodon auriga]|uniref:uncharacterized protein LOC143316110 isoform X2 n=1 Tax=Chaetodon auriga TaxID=39042 RepID=UPI004032DBBC